MGETVQALLQRALSTQYAQLLARLSRRLGSSDLAQEALHEIWLRLKRPAKIANVSNPEAYLYRAALNTATNIRKASARRLSAADIEAAVDIADDAPGPERIVDARVEVARLEVALAELPRRQRAVLLASLLENLSYEQIAEREGVTVRTVHSDIRHAIEHCAQRLGVDVLFRFDRRRVSEE